MMCKEMTTALVDQNRQHSYNKILQGGLNNKTPHQVFQQFVD